MTATTVELNPGSGGAKPVVDSLTTLDGAAAPTSAVAQLVKLIYGAAGDGRMVGADYGLPVAQTSPVFWRVGFSEVGSGLQGGGATELTLVQTGSGMAVSQSGGNLVITTGTTANSETVIRSNVAFRGALLARYKVILSQRIINQTFRFELADRIGSGLSYTINSSTSVTVSFPSGQNPFTATNVGQSLRLSVLSSVGIPGRYAIASTSGDTVTFTVAGWPGSGSGTLTLYGHNYIANEYSGTTNSVCFFDAQRRGWASGASSIFSNPTASPGHVGQIAFDVLNANFSDSLVASNTAYQWINRGSRIENIPDEDVDLYLFLVLQNGSTAPASTTTLTVGFMQAEDQPRHKVRIASSDPVASTPTPVQIMGGNLGTQPVNGTVTANIGTGALAAGTNAIGDFGIQVRANNTGAATAGAISSAGTTAPASLKAAAGRVIGWSLHNKSAGLRCIKVFNTLVGSVTMGTTSAVYEIAIPAGGTVQTDWPAGLGHSTAIVWATTSATGLTDNTATGLAAGDVVGVLVYA